MTIITGTNINIEREKNLKLNIDKNLFNENTKIKAVIMLTP